MAPTREFCGEFLCTQFHWRCSVSLSCVPVNRIWLTTETSSAFFLGLLAGGPAAIWSSYLITLVFMWITAAVLAEICSALPLSGSIYIWAAESAGPKYARFFGFIVAWWSCTAWMTFAAGNCQVRQLQTI